MSPHEHLRAWFSEQRTELIRCSVLDRLAGRPIGTFSRFLQKKVPLTYSPGITSYYPFLKLLGYEPPASAEGGNGPRTAE